MFSTQIKTSEGRITSLIFGKGDVKNAHRVDELLANGEVMSAAVVSVMEAGGSIGQAGWHNGSIALTTLVKALIEFPYQEGQRVLIATSAQTMPGSYGEIISISTASVFVRLDGELSGTPYKHSEIGAGFVNTSAATLDIIQKLGSASVLYYSRFGTIRLEQADGALEKWNIPNDIRDKKTVEYAVWRLLDTAYRSEWYPVDQHEDYGQVCHKRP